MPSTLTFPSTQGFRNKLLLRNLSPYTVPGSYTPPSGTIVREIVIRDEGVYDSPGELIEHPPKNLGPQYHGLYNLNEYGPIGGFGSGVLISQPQTVTANSGIYDVMDTSLPQQSLTGIGWPAQSIQTAEQNIPSLNKYGYNSVQLALIGNLLSVPTFTQYDVMSATLPLQSLTGIGWPAQSLQTAEQNIPSLNKYGYSFVQLTSIGNLLSVPTFSQYGVMSASLPQQSLTGQGWPAYNQGIPEQEIPTYNRYSNGIINLTSIDYKQLNPIFTVYANPGAVSFLPSSYTPYQILLQNDPTGDNGSLSQDSYIAQFGAQTLKQNFQDRIGRELARNTIGRVNLLNAVSDPVYALRILQGKAPIIERDWTITRPGNIVFRAADFAARLGGFNFPGSEIPGDYFTTDEHNLSSFGQIASAFNGGKDPRGGFLGKVFGRFLSQKSPSQLFLDNTGGGQKSQLYSSLKFNRYAPDYNKGILGELLDGAKKIINDVLDNPTKGGYYVGSKVLDASRIDSPAGEIPLDPFGQETQTPVYGPDKLANEFENNLNFKFGLNGNSLNDGGGLSGGLVWTSPKYNNPGFKAKVGGDQGPEDNEFNLVKSQLDSVNSQTYEFKQSSILDQTQRLIDSTPDGSKRLSHVGNAINQLSKVFNDGYKEITKGSQVLSYTNPKKGIHETDNVYCRVFTKDTPYYTFADLQKTEGNHRKFTYSVLDSTFNLNIAPYRNPGSTNIVDDRVKKYMFSIENLAWRTSNRPGLTYNDLPVCERGPNGGRVMWFPPYDIKFSETVTPSFQDNSFLGRPEPIYTYMNTKRDGQLSWKIVVDHPSVLNLIVDKELKNADPQTINAITDSFFAGCLKYDLYELARRWNTFNPSQLFELQQIITNPAITKDAVEDVKSELPATTIVTDTKTNDVQIPDFTKFENLGFYYDNDYPTPHSWDTSANGKTFQSEYSRYIGLQGTYQSSAGDANKKLAVQKFFDSVVIGNYNEINTNLVKEIENYFNTFKPVDGQDSQPSLEFVIVGSASAPNTKAYNVNLSKRRIDCVKNYFNTVNNGAFKNYITKGLLKISDGGSLGEQATVSPKTVGGGNIGGPFNCTDDDTNKTEYNKIYSPNAMACRRVSITKINAKKPEPSKNTGGDTTQLNNNTTETPPGFTGGTLTPPKITTTQKIKEGISKKILRSILSECDYFTLVQEQNPMFYDSMREKIKYFSPSFHSITPEGLNSRLTFLQQCTRPGDTIPTIGVDGKAKYNSSVNTSFGAPPVLVLRIGDFYNTKIIPTSLNITYEPLVFDLNPEGIGVQPMIANISMGFHFVGGQGLKEPIDKLQNALSFNFYGNTEMYDERAEWTDDSFKKIDADLVKAILDQSPVVGVNDVKNNLQNEGGDTIGVIADKITDDIGTSGSTSFQKIMDALLTEGQSYIDIMYGKTKQIVKDYNLPIYNLFVSDRNFESGKTREFVTPTDLKIYGKPSTTDTQVTKLFDLLINDINRVKSDTDEGFTFIRLLYLSNIPSTTINQVKLNLVNEVKKVQSDIATSLSQVNQELTQSQVNLVRILRKIDIVDTKTDGYIKSDQTAKIYNLTATTEVQSGAIEADTYEELVNDYSSGTTKLYSYYNLFKDKGFIGGTFDPDNIKLSGTAIGPIPSCPECDKAEHRFYTVMSKVILNDNTFKTFKDNVVPTSIASVMGNATVMNLFETAFDTGRRVSYKKEYDDEQKTVSGGDNSLESEYNKTYKPWNPFVLGKTRKFTFSDYTSGTTVQSTYIQNLYKNGNSNTDVKTFNGKNKFN
jgi:hypothetical protein